MTLEQEFQGFAVTLAEDHASLQVIINQLGEINLGATAIGTGIAADPRYADAPVVLTEALKLVLDRALPYWDEAIVPDLTAGKTVLVAAHGNSLRAIVKYLDGVSDEDIAGLNIPTGIPLVYHLDADFKPTNPGGTYLDPEAAAAAITAVANQGKK